MMKKKSIYISLILINLTFYCFCQSINSVEKGLYLLNGKIYSFDVIKNKNQKLQLFNDSIINFSLSLSTKYIAYEKLIKYVDSPGIYESTPPKKAVCSIIVYDLKNNVKIKEIYPKDNEYIYIEKWITDEKLLYISSDGFSVVDWFVYKINNKIESLGYTEKLKEYESTIFSKDLKIKLFVDSLNCLHRLDLTSKNDIKIHQTKNQIYDIALSNNKEFLSWFEIANFDETSQAIPTIDIVYLKSKLNNSLLKIYEDKALGKSSKKCLNFSFNDSIVSIELFNKIILVDIGSKKQTIIDGNCARWIDLKTLIYSVNDNLYFYNIIENKNSLFQKNAKNFEPIKYIY